MKKTLFRSVLFLLIVALMAPVFSGCGPESARACISYGDYQVSRATYLYLCSSTKTEYLYEAYGVDSSTVTAGQLTDKEVIWKAVAADGTTAGDALKSEVLESLELYLYFRQYAKDQGYELNAEQIKMVKNEFDSMVAENFGDKKKFNEYLSKYGSNYDELLEYNMIQVHAYQGEQLLFGEGGSMAVSQDSAKKYFDKNYITAECLFINTSSKTYPNGKVVILPEEEKKEKEDLVHSLEAKIRAGEDFASLAVAHSDLAVTEEEAARGFTFSAGGFVNEKAEEAAFAAKEGELVRVDTEKGSYLIRRKALDQSYYAEASEDILDLLKNAKKASLVADHLEDFKLDEDFLNGVDISAIPHLV